MPKILSRGLPCWSDDLPDAMWQTGRLCSDHKVGKHDHLTDAELAVQIQALDLVINYLRGRGDLNLVTFALEMDRQQFIGYASARESSR